MKPITGRIAFEEFDHLWGSSQYGQPLFDSKSILWQMNLPGLSSLTSLRVLLRSAAVERREESFPYSQIAETLLRQQMAVFGAWRAPWRSTPQQWRDGVLIDLGVRARIPKGRSIGKYSIEAIYSEYLRFAQVMGLRTEQLPDSIGSFNAWAGSDEMVGRESEWRTKALRSITNMSPLFWPVNIAVILYLLPEECW
jgi:hypothetical protein